MLKAGDNRAFDELYNRHWKALYQTAYYILRDENACMDILQDIFVWLWEHHEHLVLTSVRGYLTMAVKYKVSNYIRRLNQQRAFYGQVTVPSPVPAEGELSVELKELKALVIHFTEGLPGRCKEIFLLSRNEYLSNRQIAQKLGISEKTVENQITTALKRLRMKLGNLSSLLIFF
ncbi:RNA polymerase sigma-70 factor [Chitinophaga sp. XS-30]|uniref:RNA polymerase sigma-70 factor n=1 Tax=Chitinophaga sp. XS-30 TaxID=2604421 RepID=UPI00143DE77E|nr:RNA polymerase sigma-70 factor [Chitinophaga sp. XS-30]